MKIVIAGAGFTGTQLARTLADARDDVVLVDRDPVRVRDAGDQVDCTVLEADASDLGSLEAAGIASADAFVTLTGEDEINMIACSLVDAVYPRVRTIARVRNYAYCAAASAARRRAPSGGSSARPLYGIDVMLNPEVEVADAISAAIEHGAIGGVVPLDAGFGIVTLAVGEGSPLAGTPLAELPATIGRRCLVAFVESDGGAPFLPDGKTVLAVGDRIGLVTPLSEVQTLVSVAKTPQAPLRRVVVFGADRVGSLLLARLHEKRKAPFWRRLFGHSPSVPGRELAVVDRDSGRCREIATRFPGVSVLCGDVTDEALLREEDVFSCDLIVAASGNRELNLVTAAYLKSRGAKKAIALTEHSSYGEIARKLGVDVTVPLRDTVVDAVRSCLRGVRVEAVHSVCDRRFEIVEGRVSPASPAVGKPLKSVAGAGDFLVLLYRSPSAATCAVPGGDTVVEADARAVFIAAADDPRPAGLFFGGG